MYRDDHRGRIKKHSLEAHGLSHGIESSAASDRMAETTDHEIPLQSAQSSSNSSVPGAPKRRPNGCILSNKNSLPLRQARTSGARPADYWGRNGIDASWASSEPDLRRN